MGQQIGFDKGELDSNNQPVHAEPPYKSEYLLTVAKKPLFKICLMTFEATTQHARTRKASELLHTSLTLAFFI